MSNIRQVYYFIVDGCFTTMWDSTWRVSDWWCHLRKHLGRYGSNYFMYRRVGPVRPTLPHTWHFSPHGTNARCNRVLHRIDKIFLDICFVNSTLEQSYRIV